jgi:hypothetical protein
MHYHIQQVQNLIITNSGNIEWAIANTTHINVSILQESLHQAASGLQMADLRKIICSTNHWNFWGT